MGSSSGLPKRVHDSNKSSKNRINNKNNSFNSSDEAVGSVDG